LYEDSAKTSANTLALEVDTSINPAGRPRLALAASQRVNGSPRGALPTPRRAVASKLAGMACGVFGGSDVQRRISPNQQRSRQEQKSCEAF
jgi:hypothetical protein